MHFGMGEHKRVDQIEIIWPSGINQVLENIETGQILTITESASP
jgi:hypothetical protein